MARVPEAELERIKAEVSLERLAEAKGVELRRHGADLLGLCPFHEDREPSLVISPAKNLWHCLGACRTGGSVVDWVMRAEGVAFRHAVELLRTDPSLAATAAAPGVKRSTVPRLPSPVATDATDQHALRQVVAFYRQTLRESPEAMAYLGQRGLADREALDHFQVGFANRTLGLRLPFTSRTTGAELRGQLQRVGVLRESGHEHFNGSIVIPVLDDDGNVVEMYGRKITSVHKLRKGTPLHLYLPGPHRGVWNADNLTDHVILCEALLDALTFYVHGLHNVTAAYGIEGFTEEHLQTLVSKGVARVSIAYDRDAAGDKAAVQLAAKLVAAGITADRVKFPEGMDANSYACQELTTAGERLQALVQRAVPLGTAMTIPTPFAPNAAAHRDADARAEAGQGETTPADATPTSAIPLPSPAPTDPSFAAATPPATPADITVTEDDLSLTFGERSWRVRGLSKVTQDGALRVNLLLRTADDCFHVDTLDLYVSKQRQTFTKEAAAETGVLEETVRRDVGRVLLQTEQVIAERRRRESEAEQAKSKDTLSDEDRAAGMALLQSGDLLDEIVAAYDRIGVVGERTNKLVAYLAATSRLLERPLAVVMQSSSAAGKSSLLEATLALLPDSARAKYSAMTGQSLYYMGEQELAHKVLAVVEEEGAERAAYALKLLQSEGELTIASTGKDPQTGKLVTHPYHVRGPVALFLTTTAINVDEELLNRCLVLTVDEEREQTEAIHRRQRERETLQGLLADHDRQRTIRLHRAAQTLLQPVHVVNPFAPQLTFAATRTRTRRDHQKYLALIRTIALLHQHQRMRKSVETEAGPIDYIEVIPADIATANAIAHEVLGRSLDELPPQTRRLLLLLDDVVTAQMRAQGFSSREEVRLTRKEIRDLTGWGHSQLAVHLNRLVEMEYVALCAGTFNRTHLYAVIWSGERGERDGGAVLPGLMDPDTLTESEVLPVSEVELPGVAVVLPGRIRPASGPVPGRVRGEQSDPNPNADKAILPFAADNDENAVPGSDGNESRPAVPLAVAR